MRVVLFSVAVLGAGWFGPAVSQEISPGSRVVITSEWHEQNGGPYSPRIVDCSAESGICLRDTRSEPADKPMMQTDDGLRVEFPSWGLAYLFRAGGTGEVFDTDGNSIGPFQWTQ